MHLHICACARKPVSIHCCLELAEACTLGEEQAAWLDRGMTLFAGVVHGVQ